MAGLRIDKVVAGNIVLHEHGTEDVAGLDAHIAESVTGPASATDSNFASFDSTTGRVIKDSTYSPSSFAVAAKGVTNGDSHDHNGGDGGQIAYSSLSGLPTLPSNEAGSANNFLTAYNSTTGAFSKAQPTWANINKSTSSIADIATRSHTSLTDIGTNTHAQIDTHISASNPHSGSAPLASPTFTGTPAAPTPSATDDSTKIATTAFVNDWQIRAYPEDLASFKKRMTTGKTFDEFFDSTSLPAGHSWASDATFTALTAGTGSGTYDLNTYPSALWYDVRTGVRSFLYKSGTPTTSMIFTGGFGSAGTDSTVALRLDDGTDNNYVEGGLVSQSGGASWSWQMKTRSGGGAVTTTTSTDNVVVPFVFNMLLNITGTKWSSWSANFWISIPYAAPAVLQMNKVAPTFTMTWTPTRYGLTMRAPAVGANIGLVDHWGWNP